MNEEGISEGIKLFAKNAIAIVTISRVSDLAYEVTFHGERHSAVVEIETLGLAISYFTPLQMLQGTRLATTLLLKNWGSVDCTGFYFSVHVQDGQPWLFLETQQFLGPNATPEHVASIIGACCIKCRQAAEAWSTGQVDTSPRSVTCRICTQTVQIDNVPIDVAMRVYEGLAPLICRRCITQQGIPVERVGPQDRIWFQGEKYLGYEDSFVLI